MVERVIAHRIIENDEVINEGLPTDISDVYFDGRRDGMRDIAIDLCNIFEADNPNFNVEQFMVACEFDKEPVEGVWL